MIHIVWFVVVLVFSPVAFGFDYFNNTIDYWQEKQAIKAPKKPDPKPQAKEQPAQPKAGFDWSKHMDPKNDEFFKEGDHTPPAPFMELARNPTDENIKRWFTMIDLKNQMMERMHVSMANYLQKNQMKLNTEEKDLIAQNTQKMAPQNIDVKRFRFRLYFESSCPHCHHMMATMKDLQDLGYYGELRQVDKNKPNFPLPFAAAQASPEELKSREITSWPVLFIADTGKKLIYRVNGYQTTEQVLQILASK
jgi:thiol-disulfide isomerase/thioredoxin